MMMSCFGEKKLRVIGAYKDEWVETGRVTALIGGAAHPAAMLARRSDGRLKSPF